MTSGQCSDAAGPDERAGAALLAAVFAAPTRWGTSARVGGALPAEVTTELVPGDPARRVGVMAWLRARTVLTLRTAAPVRSAFEAATPVAYQLHARTCAQVLDGGCRTMESVLAAVRADLVGDGDAGDRELGAALAVDPADTVMAAAAVAAAAYVAVDGTGAGAVIAALRPTP